MKLFDRIWAWILTLIISIFPSLSNYAPALDWEAATKTVLTAIQSRDIATIESFMCKNIKDNTPNLSEEIGKLIDGIEGKMTKLTKSASNGSGFHGSVGGKTIDQKAAVWMIETSEGTYALSIDWEFYNNFSYAERGMRSLGLTKKLDKGSETIALIMATDGIGNMHS